MISRSDLGNGFDPDDLAVVLCRIIREKGLVPKVTMKLENGAVVAIEVRTGGRFVASFPCYAIPPDGTEELARLIEQASERAVI